MDMETYYKQFENCLQEEKPFCADDCPFHMDVLDFMDKMSQKRYSAAYKVFRNAAAFPEIVAAICPKYCGSRCPAADAGGAVQINTLEKTCIAMTKRKDPNEYNLPPRKGRIAIVGAGLSGLCCALRLASRKYDVTVYEKSSAIGGQLRDMMPEELFLEDIDRQFKYETYTLHLHTEITDIQQLTAEGFDAVYAATGRGGNDLGALTAKAENEPEGGAASPAHFCYVIDDTGAVCHGKTAVFAGGSLLGKDVIHAAADGLAMAREIEGFLKTGIARYPQAQQESRVVADTAALTDIPPVTPSSGDVFTEEEAAAEVSRCIRCQCNACRIHCDLTDYFDKWPLQMRDEIMTTTMPANSMIRKAPAIRLINMCTQCGLCDETCPGQLQLGRMIRDARKILHKIHRMPGAYHQFWVMDMEFANGKYAAVAKCPPGKSSCSYAFFPGCHLGAADPRYVTDSYRALLGVNDDVGLLLRCCGVPADWAGNEEMHLQELAALRADWERLGKPTLIMACPSCMRHFREYLPEIPVLSLYEALEQWQVPLAGMKEPADRQRACCTLQDTVFSIFDPCAARKEDSMQESVRRLLAATGAVFRELPGGAKHGCCGFGGNSEVPDPKFAKKVRQDRIALSDDPYITYCINCRDIFHDEGKPVKHALDILLDIPSPEGALPTVTERRRNRVLLKEKLLKSIWGETMNEKPQQKYELLMRDDIKAKMNRLKLSEEDVCHVLEMGEVHGRRAFDPENSSYKCYRQIGHITCWAEYRPLSVSSADDPPQTPGGCTLAGIAGYELLNVYTHRMKIELEVIFNGRKADHDLR